MNFVGTVAEQTQRLLDRGFLLSAFLPLAATTFGLWVVLSGSSSVLSTLDRLAGQPVGETAVTAGLIFIGSYLVAFVAHGLRRALRDAWSGAIPPAVLHEGLVSWQLRRFNRLDRQLTLLGYELNAVYWLRQGGLDPSAARDSDRVPEGDEAFHAIVKRCERRLARLRNSVAFGATARARRLLLELHALAGLDPLPDAASNAINRARRDWQGESADERRVADRLDAAALRIQQRWGSLEDRIATSYPPVEALQGTRLGNVLARAEHYSTRRYKIPLKTLWPRLRIVASDDDLELVEDALVRVDFALATTTGGLAVAMTAVMVCVLDVPSTERVIVGVVAAAVSIGLYRFAVVAARLYGEQVAATVDLHLPALDSRLAALIAQEVDRDALYHFLARADDVIPTAGSDKTGGPSTDHGSP